MTAKARSGPAKILVDAGVPAQRVAATLRKLERALGIGRHTSAKLDDPAAEYFARALALEATDLAAAREAYAAALAIERGHLEASINLGRLQHLNGELAAAERTYRAARQASATLSYNLALLLEDLHRDEEAARAYQQALAQQPSLHEAHLHLGRLHERRQRPREALMHLLAFRRHSHR
jgi:protein O-GlcNAc transferase